MIPIAVASEVLLALRDFLRTGFGPSNPEMAGVVRDFLARPGNLARGPYLTLGLPFERASEGGEPFPDIPLGFKPYKHQRTAFSRLAADSARSTVVATGTGSGKTECFLYPMLDHCRRQARKKGVKAVVVYPMNALAADQARRIAALVRRTPALRGKVTAGLFIGQRGEKQHKRMSRTHVVTDRNAMRERPPDILLTNYKMLDYLLIRPRDQRLWRHNEPDTLRYLVVDELHTFDGAQGTDLACLIRRLRMRLGTPAERLICVGTSATLGGDESRDALRSYVSRIFDQEFDRDAIVGEARQSIDAFLGGALISRHLLPQGGLAEALDHRRCKSSEEYLHKSHEVFFGGPPEEPEQEWRVALGERLKEHVVFVNLLRALDGRPRSLPELAQRLRRSLPVASDGEARAALDAMCALISAARVREGDGPEASLRPFLDVGVHLWVRELRRMVCSLGGERGDDTREDGNEQKDRAKRSPRFTMRHSDDLRANEKIVHLPLVQCRECHVTGWVTRRAANDSRIVLSASDEDGLNNIYAGFFGGDIDTTFLFPETAPAVIGGRAKRGMDSLVCAKCGQLVADPGSGRGKSRAETEMCGRCQSEDLVRVFRSGRGQRATRRGRSRLAKDCPYCDARNALVIVGAQSASLLASGLTQTIASRHNDDPKIIAFSDNVQDAAHRAGFLSARTWRTNMRAAILQAVGPDDAVSLADLLHKVADRQQTALDPEDFVGEFIAHDQRWRQHFGELERTGRLPENSLLPKLVAERMRWQTLAEFGWRSAIGRTLERTRAAAVGVDRRALTCACDDALPRLQNEIEELREIGPEVVEQLLLGLVRRMKDRGAFWPMTTVGENDVIRRYVASGGDTHVLHRDRALPNYGPTTLGPIFPGERAQPRKVGIETLIQSGSGAKSWYQKWTEKVLGGVRLGAASQESKNVLGIAFQVMETAGLIHKASAGSGLHAWGLAPEHLYVATDVVELRAAMPNASDASDSVRSPVTGRPLVVPADEADLWQGVPSLDLASPGIYAQPVLGQPTWFGRLYREMAIRRIVAAEHTALIDRDDRERMQKRFAASGRRPWHPNVLSATPTLELGIDIGELSTVMLCSVPPSPANYVQRAGRAGRRDGNAFTLAVATGQPHDLYFYAEPMDMLASGIDPPGVFLNAGAVLERQLTAFCFDSWVASGVDEDAVPRRMRAVLDNVERGKLREFPYPFFEFVRGRADSLAESFVAAFTKDLSETNKERLTTFLAGRGHKPDRHRDSLEDGIQGSVDDQMSPEYGAQSRVGDGDGPKRRQSGEHAAYNRENAAPLFLRMLERFTEVVKERKSVKAEVNRLARRIATLEGLPQDEVTADETIGLKRERASYQGVLRAINDRETYNFLTDEGLVPNYAFPEKGVTLRSVIYRKQDDTASRSAGAQSDDNGRNLAEIAPEVFKYERPAAAALSEFAPENVFYAGARKVAIERIDMGMSEIERWRLCPSCAYCEKVDAADRHNACPRCEDPMWADSGQLREMLPLRMVHAATPDGKSRISDDRDQRDPRFYTRHLAADFDPDAVSAAFAVGDPGLSFGFEYISSVTFREMNFGIAEPQGQPTRVAGREMPRKGFRVCRHCGKVQGKDPGKPEHTRTCRAAKRTQAPRGSGGPSPVPVGGAETTVGGMFGNGAGRDDDIADCIYLYREFQSEAIRMLVPGLGGLDADKKGLHSFIAALELGLRRKFGGEIAHLNTTDLPISGADANQKRTYLLLYDTVPGGTGYLKDRMTDPQKLLAVFEAAHEALKNCVCVHDPDKDGCYRCVFAYRRRRALPHTSRKEAERIVAAVLKRGPDLAEVEGLDEVRHNPLAESELEERFVKALKRAADTSVPRRHSIARPRVRIRDDLVRGKPGHVLSVGDATYFVEPQAEVGPTDGVAVPSRPDFMIRPARRGNSQSAPGPPVAVFLDGFEYHRDETGADSAKRMALVRAGYLVWSLTWQDLESEFGGSADAPDLLAAKATPSQMDDVQQKLDARWGAGGHRDALGLSSFDLLLHYLAAPEPLQWGRAVFTALLGLFDRERMRSPELHAAFARATDESLPGQAFEEMAERARTMASVVGPATTGEDEHRAAAKAEDRDRTAATHPADDSLQEVAVLLQQVAVAGWGPWTRMAADHGAAAEPAHHRAAATSPTDPSFSALFLALPLSAMRDPSPAGVFAALHLDDHEPNRSHPDYRLAWNGILRLFNRLQFVPGAWWTTEAGTSASLYPEFALPSEFAATEDEAVPPRSADEPPATPSAARSEDWAAAIRWVAPDLRALAETLADAGLPAPEAGCELLDDAGRVVAEAELGWPEHKIGVLLPGEEGRKLFEAVGWRAFSASSEGLAGQLAHAVGGPPASSRDAVPPS